MCFDIDVINMTLEALRETLQRLSSLVAQPSVVERLPDGGHQLKGALEKVREEIKFRENLDAASQKMKELSLKSASDSNMMSGSHDMHLCSLENRSEQQRFKPNMTKKALSSGRTESMQELHTGVKSLDLALSLRLQKEQDERVKSGLMRAKQDRLLAELAALKGANSEEKPANEATEASVPDEKVPEPEAENVDLGDGPSSVEKESLAKSEVDEESSVAAVPEEEKDDAAVPEEEDDAAVPEEEKNDAAVPEEEKDDGAVPEDGKDKEQKKATEEEPGTSDDK